MIIMSWKNFKVSCTCPWFWLGQMTLWVISPSFFSFKQTTGDISTKNGTHVAKCMEGNWACDGFMRKENIQPWLPVVSNELVTRYFPVVFTHSKGNELFLGVRRNGRFNRVLQAVTMVGCWWDHRHSIRLHFRIRVITSSTAQGGGGSFKNRKPIGELGCCESGMAERIH